MTQVLVQSMSALLIKALSNAPLARSWVKEIWPLIDDMLDFKKAMAKRLNVDHEKFKRKGSYQLFRAGLIDRWNVLDELGDFPHLLAPLSI